MNTTPETQSVQPFTRKDALSQWVKRTQEILAYRSQQGLQFNRLYNLLRTKRLTEVALENVLQNNGAKTPGIDGVTKYDLATDEAKQELIEELNGELCNKTYHPRPVRRTYIPKDNGEQRPLGIPTIRDRVVQEMLRLLLEPIYEGHFYKHSYGFRPYRSTHHAALRIKDLIGNRGYKYAIEGDIRKCFDRIHHQKLLQILRKVIRDESVIYIIRQMLKSGVREDNAWSVTDEGTPQGGIVSPLLANIYLNELDQFIADKWEYVTDKERQRRRRNGEHLPCYITRYADDFVVLVHGDEQQAVQLKAEIAEFLNTELHLELSEEKTLITSVEEGFDFLGFQIRKFTGATLITPSRKAMIKFRKKVKQRIEDGFKNDNDAGAIAYINQYLFGWAMYYRRVSSAREFRNADHYVWWRVFRTSKRYRNPKLYGGQHYKAHYLPYAKDIRRMNRRHKGKNYGMWADREQTVAHIIMAMRFIPIRYINQHPQLNPYIPEEREKLEKRVGQLELPPEQLPDEEYRSDYGWEWRVTRQYVLELYGHRCYRCQKQIKGQKAHVHHRKKLRNMKSRQQANLIDNLVPLCSSCHSWHHKRNLQLEPTDNT
jgi:RNA-directed DNA polymerase